MPSGSCLLFSDFSLPLVSKHTLAPTHYSWISKYCEAFHASISVKMLFSLPEMPSPGPSFCPISFYLFSNNLSQKIFPLILWFTPYPERNSFLLCVSKILVAASPTLAQEFEEGDCTSSGPHLAYGPHLEHVALALSVLKLSSKVTANNLPSSHPNEHF